MKRTFLYAAVAASVLSFTSSCSNSDPVASTTYYCDMMDVVTQTNGDEAGKTQIFGTVNTYIIDYAKGTMLYGNHVTLNQTMDLRSQPIDFSFYNGMYHIKAGQFTPQIDARPAPDYLVQNFSSECMFTKHDEFCHASYDITTPAGVTYHVFSFDTDITFNYSVTMATDGEGKVRKIDDIYFNVSIDPNLQTLNLTVRNAPVGDEGRLIEVLQIMSIPVKPVLPTAEDKQDGFTFAVDRVIPIVELQPFPGAEITDMYGEIHGTSGKLTLNCRGISYDITLHSIKPIG